VYEDREQKMKQLKQLIERGEYRVRTDLVADAIVHRLLQLRAARTDQARTARRPLPR